MYLHKAADHCYDVYRRLDGGLNEWSVVRIYKPYNDTYPTGLHWTENISRVFNPTSTKFDGSDAGWTVVPNSNPPWWVPRSYSGGTTINPNTKSTQIVHHRADAPASDTSDYVEHDLPAGATTHGMVFMGSWIVSLFTNCRLEYYVDNQWVKADNGEMCRIDGSGRIDRRSQSSFGGEGDAYWLWSMPPAGATKFRIYATTTSPHYIYISDVATATPCNPGDSGWQVSNGHEIKSRTGSDVFYAEIGGDQFGDHHGNETGLSYTVKADGAVQSMSTGDVVQCSVVDITATTALDAGTNYGALTKRFRVWEDKRSVTVTWVPANSPTITTLYLGSETLNSSNGRIPNNLVNRLTTFDVKGTIVDYTGVAAIDSDHTQYPVPHQLQFCRAYGPRYQRTTVTTFPGLSLTSRSSMYVLHGKWYPGLDPASFNVSDTLAYTVTHCTSIRRPWQRNRHVPGVARRKPVTGSFSQ